LHRSINAPGSHDEERAEQRAQAFAASSPGGDEYSSGAARRAKK